MQQTKDSEGISTLSSTKDNPGEDESTQIKRILLVDDEKAFLKATASLLRLDGYDVVALDSGDRALQEITDSHIDLAVIDIHLPGNNGLELVEAIAEYDEYLPIILVTGEPTVETAIQSISLFIKAYLLKPVKYDELKRVIEKSIEEYDVHRKIRAAQEEMNNLEKYVTGSIASSLHSPSITASELFTVSANGIVNILQDMKTLVNSFTRGGADPALCRLCKKEEYYLNTIRDTVQVLEKTKRSFKSKELAGLRIRLEAILTENQGARV